MDLDLQVLSVAILWRPASMDDLCQGGGVDYLSLLPGGLAGFPSRRYIGIVDCLSLCVGGTVGRLRLHSGGSVGRLSLFCGGSVGRPSLFQLGIVRRLSLYIGGTVSRLRLHLGGSVGCLSSFHGGSVGRLSLLHVGIVGRPSLCHDGIVRGHWETLRCVLWPGVRRACRHISVRLYVLAVELHFGARPFAEQDAVAGLHVEGDDLPLFVAGALILGVLSTWEAAM